MLFSNMLGSTGVSWGSSEVKWLQVGSRGTRRGQVRSSGQYGERFGFWVGKRCGERLSDRLGKRLILIFSES